MRYLMLFGLLFSLAACDKQSMVPVTRAAAQTGDDTGQLLYETHCVACHGEEIHWRDKRLAKDWDSLLIQVEHWQASMHLLWRQDEIFAVARYLNALHYGYPEPAHKSYTDSDRKIFIKNN
jgi:hypothetical protein